LKRDGLAARLRALAERIERIRPLNHDPEAYFVERDAIRRDLLREVETLERRGESASPPRERFETGQIAGRRGLVKVEIRRGRRQEPKCPNPQRPPTSRR
jgi:hypothetical protein